MEEAFELATCPLCASPDRADYARYDELTFVSCAACGLVYKAFEQPELRAPDFYEGGYYQFEGGKRLRRFEHRRAKARGLLRNALALVPAKTLLDVGCAVGEVVAAGRDLGLESMGCDLSRFAVDYCNERGLPARVGDLHHLPVEDGAIDLIMLKHVLEHTHDPRGALRELRRALTPGGAVCVLVPDLDYWKARWMRRRGKYFMPRRLGRQHFVYYRAKHLERLLQSDGFDVLATSKAVLRRRAGEPRSPSWGERLRFGSVWIWQALAQLLHLRREVVLIARRSASVLSK